MKTVKITYSCPKCNSVSTLVYAAYVSEDQELLLDFVCLETKCKWTFRRKIDADKQSRKLLYAYETIDDATLLRQMGVEPIKEPKQLGEGGG